MYTRNKICFDVRCYQQLVIPILTFIIFFIPPFSSLILSANPQERETHSFTSSKGLKLKIIKSKQIPFVHAQLVIYYNEKPKNPSIPYLTYMNIFDRNIRESDTPVLEALKKLGNDFEIEHRPDFLLIKVNFLLEKQQSFIRFLKALYSYKPFQDFNSPANSFNDQKKQMSTKARFKDSIDNYWKYFFRQKNWKEQIAFQIAYHHFFPDAMMGQVLVTPKDFKSVQFEQVLEFYEKTFQLSNSLLVLKGNIENPALFLGHLERTFPSSKKIPPLKHTEEKLTINAPKKILIFNSDTDEYPNIYWFKAVLYSGKENPVTSLVLNNILFSMPTGRIFLNARFFNISNPRINTEMLNHRQVSIMCNTIRLKYDEVEKFLLLAEREQKKLQRKDVERREYLNTLSNIYQRLKVNTQDYENEINLELMDKEYYTKKVTLAGLNEIISDSNHEIIIIIGSARLLLPQLEPFKAMVGVIDFNL